MGDKSVCFVGISLQHQEHTSYGNSNKFFSFFKKECDCHYFESKISRIEANVDVGKIHAT